MILSASETQIVSHILKQVFDADVAPNQIRGIQIHSTELAESVVVVTDFALYTLGKDYFRQLVTELKPKHQSKSVTTKPIREVQEVVCLQQDGVASIWQVVGDSGNLYLVSHNAVSGRTKCGCKAGSFGRSCYHATSVKEVAGTWLHSNAELATYLEQQAEAIAPTRYRTPSSERGISSLRFERKPSDEKICEGNRKALNRGAKLASDGTVVVDERFYQLMGSVSQVRGASMREMRKKALFA